MISLSTFPPLGARGVMSEISDWVSSLAAGGALAGPAADGAADVAAALAIWQRGGGGRGGQA